MNWEIIITSALTFVAIIVLGILVLQIRNASTIKKQKAHYTRIHENLKPGAKVTFSQGLFGQIVSVEKDTVDIKVKSGAVMTVSRYAISGLLED